MLSPGPATKIYLAAGATDLRAGFERLSVLVQAVLGQSAVSGHLFVFCNDARTRIKILYWDGNGLWLLTNRHAPQCAYRFVSEDSLSISSVVRKGVRNVWCGWRCEGYDLCPACRPFYQGCAGMDVRSRGLFRHQAG